MARVRKYPEELLERATRLVVEPGRPIAHVGRDLGIARETLRKYVRRIEADEGRRKDILSSEEREDQSAAQGGCAAAPRQRDPEGRQRVFRGRARPTPSEVSAFIAEYRERFGVEPICSTLGVSAADRGRAAACEDQRAA